MKSKHLLFLLLLAFMTPWAANAYNHQVQVGNGTSGQNIAPINLYYNYSYTQQIYTAAQINGDCSLPGDIESISFYYAGSVAKTVPITVFMKTTEKTSFSSTTDWETVTENDIVFNGDWEIPSTAGWVTITLNAPFAYDGESNLLIAIDKGYYSNYTNQNWRYTAVTNNQVIQYRNDGTDPNPYSPTTASGISNNLPNILFNMTIAHPAPSALTVDEVVINTATISWTAPQTTNTITGYAYEYTDGETIETGTATGTTANLTGLTAATDYLFEVKAIYSDGESCWSEALDFTTMEACMTPENLSITNVTAHTADLTWTEGFGDGQWVLQYKLSTEEEYTTSVNVALADLPYTLTGLTAESTYNVQISPVCDDTKTLTGNFTTTVACFAPTNLAVEANVQTATFTWESDVNDYEIAHATVATADPIDNIVGTATDTVYSMSNLTIDTDHYFWVRSNCGSEGYSAWAGPASVHIGYCVPNPSTRDGKGITKVIFGIGDNIVNNVDETNGLPATSPYYGNYSSMVGAMQAGVESTISITYATGSNTVYSYGTIIWVDWDNSLSFEDSEIVYTGTSVQGSGGVPQVLEASFTVPVNQATGEYRMRIAGADSYFDSYIGGNSTGNHSACFTSTYAVCHDYTLRVLEAPSCLAPTGLTVSDVTAHNATISWTSDAEAWEIQLDEEEAIEVTETTYTFTGLTAETTYSVKVRTNCGGTYSDWTNPVSFTTGIACPAPTDLDAALTPGNGSIATLSWTSSASAWVVAYKTADDEEFTEVNVTENPYTLTGLTPETAYTAKVKAVCGGIDGESQWSSTVTFTPTDAYALTVNDGTTTNSYVPVYGTWVDSYTKCQFIIPASELVDMQYGNISKMTFYSSTQNKTWGAAEFDILLAEVDNTTFESATLVDWADMDQVYHGAVSISDYKMEIVFDNDYQYMGGNLLVGFHQTVKGTYGGISWYGVSSTNSAIGGYENSAKALSLQSFLPKTTFDYVPGEAPACLKPTNLSVNYEGGITATVTWEGTATSYNIDVNGTVIEGVTSPYTLEGLELATTYTVMVQANCGEDLSDWTNAASFTTDLCMPENQCELTFVLTDSYGDGWNGAYIDVVDVATGESLAHMSNQNLSKGDPETETYTLTVCDGRELQFVWYSGSYDSEASYVVTDINGEEIFSGSGAMSEPVNYTVNCTPITCFRPTDVEVAYITNDAATVQWNGTSDSYQVQYRTLNGEWTTIETENLAAELTDLAANTTYEYQVRGFCDADSTYSDWTSMATFTTLDICTTPEDLVVTSGANSATATWTGVQDSYNVYWRLSSETEYTHSTSVNATNYTIEGLQSGQSYSVKVEGVCTNGVSDAIEETFSTALLWTDPEVWNNPENPNYSGDPEQNAPEVITVTENTVVVIPENASIEVNQIVMENGSEIIIEEGGELAYTVDDPTDPNAAAQGIDVTMSMTITPSGAKSGTDYRLIASPIYQTIDVVDCGLTENYYGMDLYSFDASYPGAEWRNYKTNDNFDNLEIGKGYLYYNSESVFVTFYGQTVPSNVIYPINLTYADNAQDATWKGLNLIGNPFTCKAVPSKPFFVLNDAGNEIVTTASTAAYVAPMRGFFVVAENASDVCNVTRYTGSTKSALNMTVNQNDDLVDVAVVNFSKGENLRKVQLNPNHTKIYMPVEGNDYAVANAESNAGEMPVNFKAEHNGSYTLNFGIDNVNFNYLHLIDNMTGADVDLLATPYYTFNANSTDYASRFKLVYATGDNSNDDNFAFFNNGNIIINNDGEATLQVVDVMGRILKSESINGSTSVNLNVAPGVYMLRLINGNDMKVQKMIVK